MRPLALDPQVIRWTIGGVAADPIAAIAALTDHPLLVLMHGLGSNEGDLIGLAPLLPQGFVCAALRAPLDVPEPLLDGYTWFPLSLQQSDAAPDEITDNPAWLAAQAVLDWLDGLDGQTGVAVQCAVMGFSQGGVMATSLLRARPHRFAAAVNCSGFTAPGRFPGDGELEALRPPVFWGRDELDPIIGAEAVARTAGWLPEHSQLEARLYPGMAHSISRDELNDVFVFLAQNMPGALPIR